MTRIFMILAAVAILVQGYFLYSKTEEIASFKPCYPSVQAGNTVLVSGYMKWMEIMRETDPNFAHPIDRIIPSGSAEGEWVMPNCHAVEQADGTVVFWETPLTMDMPYFTPYTAG